MKNSSLLERKILALEVGSWTTLCLLIIFSLISSFGATHLPLLLLSLGFVVLLLLLIIFSAYCVPNPIHSQRLIGIFGALMVLVSVAVSLFYLRYVQTIISSLLLIFVFYLYLGNHLSFGAKPKTLALGKQYSYSTTLIINEFIMLAIFTAHFFVSGTLSVVLFFIGIFGILLAPLYGLFTPPPAFFHHSLKHLKGTIHRNEKFIGAVYGASFPGRPKAALEKTDNALFITNSRIMCVTIPGLVFDDVQTGAPFYKVLAFSYLKEQGDKLLKKNPHAVLFAHPFTFSIPFETIKKIRCTSNFFLKLFAANLLSVTTPEGTYRFIIFYPDQYEQLKILLQKALPSPLAKSI